jgi:hypothetical protein
MHTYEPTNRLPDVLDMMEGDGTLHTGESIVSSALLSRLGTSLPHPRVSKVSRALAYAHERSVMDWGLARLEGDGTEEVHEADMSDFQTSGGGSAERIRLAKVIDGVVPAMLPLLDRPYACFGHCLGGLTRFEVARELRRRGAPDLVAIFVSGSAPPPTGSTAGARSRSGWLGCSAARLTSISS